MKNRKLIVGIFSSFLLVLLPFTYADAAKNPIGKIKIIDGKEVSYDDSSINGSVADESVVNKASHSVSVIKLIENKVLVSIPKDTFSSSFLSTLTIFINSLGLDLSSNNYLSNLSENILVHDLNEKKIEVELNNLVNNSRFMFTWVNHFNSKDETTLKENIITAIDNGNPIIINYTSSPGSVYLRGKNFGYSFSNFGLISEYSNYGDKVVYLEAGAGRFSGFKHSQIVNIKDLSYALEDGGYVW